MAWPLARIRDVRCDAQASARTGSGLWRCARGLARALAAVPSAGGLGSAVQERGFCAQEVGSAMQERILLARARSYIHQAL